MTNEKFNDKLEIGGDLQDEYKAIQAAEEFDGQSVTELLTEMWEYTEEDAFRDFIADPIEE